MKRNFEKNVHILNQLLGYCKKSGGTEMDANLCFHDEHVSITVSSVISEPDEKTILDLRKQLSIPRQHEIEQNYWNIGLSGNLGDELALVGMMIDRCEVCYANNRLTLHVERQN